MSFVSHLLEFVSQYPLEVMSVLGTVFGGLQFIPAKIKRPVLEAGGLVYEKIKEYHKLKKEVKRLKEKIERMKKEKEKQNQTNID